VRWPTREEREAPRFDSQEGYVREEEEEEEADQPKEELQGSSAKPVTWARTRRKQAKTTEKGAWHRCRTEEIVAVLIAGISIGKRLIKMLRPYLAAPEHPSWRGILYMPQGILSRGDKLFL
jgi:hypothetical protein